MAHEGAGSLAVEAPALVKVDACDCPFPEQGHASFGP